LRPSALEVLESPLIQKIRNTLLPNKSKIHFESSPKETHPEIIAANNTMKVVSLLEEETHEKTTIQDNFWVKSPQPLIEKIPEPSSSLVENDISIFHLSFGDQKKIETVLRNDREKELFLLNAEKNNTTMSTTVIDSSRPTSANDFPQDHHQKRLRNIQRMIPRNNRRSQNPSIMQKESTENQQLEVSNSRKPVIMNNFNLTPTPDEKKVKSKEFSKKLTKIGKISR